MKYKHTHKHKHTDPYNITQSEIHIIYSIKNMKAVHPKIELLNMGTFMSKHINIKTYKLTKNII